MPLIRTIEFYAQFVLCSSLFTVAGEMNSRRLVLGPEVVFYVWPFAVRADFLAGCRAFCAFALCRHHQYLLLVTKQSKSTAKLFCWRPLETARPEPPAPFGPLTRQLSSVTCRPRQTLWRSPGLIGCQSGARFGLPHSGIDIPPPSSS